MNSASYLDYILEKLSASYDIERDYHAVGAEGGHPAQRGPVQGGVSEVPGGLVFPAYARYASTAEKYVLTRKANLWTISEYEHVLFLTGTEKDDPEALYDYAKELISGYMEPVFVRKNGKYPPKNHMRSLLTVVLVLEASPEEGLIRKIRKYRFDKGYLFSIRGYAQGRLIAADLSAKKIYTSPAAKDAAGFFKPL